MTVTIIGEERKKALSRKRVLIRMDGVSSHFVLRLFEQGKLPNFRRMVEEGTFAPHCFSSLPTSTPENWTTIATGAWNGTHQVMSFQTFQPPELHGGWMVGYTSKERARRSSSGTPLNALGSRVSC